VCRADDATKRRVEERWSALGLGSLRDLRERVPCDSQGEAHVNGASHANGVGGIERVVRAARELLGKERGA
jgi:hypothetical protein